MERDKKKKKPQGKQQEGQPSSTDTQFSEAY